MPPAAWESLLFHWKSYFTDLALNFHLIDTRNFLFPSFFPLSFPWRYKRHRCLFSFLNHDRHCRHNRRYVELMLRCIPSKGSSLASRKLKILKSPSRRITEDPCIHARWTQVLLLLSTSPSFDHPPLSEQREDPTDRSSISAHRISFIRGIVRDLYPWR